MDSNTDKCIKIKTGNLSKECQLRKWSEKQKSLRINILEVIEAKFLILTSLKEQLK